MRGFGAALACVVGAVLLSGCGREERRADDLFAQGSERIASGDYAEGVALMQQILDRFPETRAAGNVRKDWGYYQELVSIQAERLPVRAAEDLRVLGRATERYHERAGRYPGDLQALVPGEMEHLPLDPWGRPYRYRLDGRSYVLETLGRDGVPGGDGEDRDMRVLRGQLVNAPRVHPPRDQENPPS